MIKLINVSKSFKNENVLNNINVEFVEGHIYGITGRNGSGKSVLFKTICGFVTPDSGDIIVNDINIYKKKVFPTNISALIEKPKFLENLSGYDNLKLLARIKNIINDEDILQVMTKLGLSKDKDKLYKNYSLGTKQKLGIAQVLMEDDKILIFDEPFSGLDDKSVNDVRKIIIEEKKKGKIIILASHIKEDIELLCDIIYRINDGQLKQINK